MTDSFEPGGESGGSRTSKVTSISGAASRLAEDAPPPVLRHLSVEDLSTPAYLVNHKFQVEWANDYALKELFGRPEGLPPAIEDSSLFNLLLSSDIVRKSDGLPELLRFHLTIAKRRASKAYLFLSNPNLESREAELLGQLYDRVEAVPAHQMTSDAEVNLASRDELPRWHRLYATFFREGIFFTVAPEEREQESFLTWLSRRDIVIRDLLRVRRPYVTSLAVLVADLQSSMRICAELPPEQYFELINSIWTTMQPYLRKYYATYGKHAGDGMLYYFLPQPDSNYIMNAIQCAFEMQTAMRKVSREWQSRKNWGTTLHLNFGLEQGEEWFGTFEGPTFIEFTALGDTINRASRLSDFSREGSIWITKSMLSRLSDKERSSIRFGIRQTMANGSEAVIPEMYSRISNLIDPTDPRSHKLLDISTLPATELFDIGGDEE
ncbi:adenylate/guanylate cyclase domain-containing protein [Rhodospirillaceae bacterium KN72]|uniref:Adenylate/guanylate cyclase domain-containing protein n=1 Tax=Pacificispira spongiicola TaxID=2729598 RepID=A0A7Y0E424_9PROT|nr:adenylate/guanylate cyclase domain-containing protein [Pacificispira spongiicola]NMM46051.1 adenylate/guanylate cyclase domain-containing protein [Pacificispira spongiicola]